MLGIVSGNLEGAARVKLGRGDLDRFFVSGGHGSDSDDRAETRTALGRAERLHGHRVPLDRVFVVGDTPRDVDAAREVGAVSVTVATGRCSVDELRAAGADHAVVSFAEGFPGLG